MQRTLFAVPLTLALLPGLAPRIVAGPPDGASGNMVLDEVADGLRKYRKEKDPEKRAAWLERLAPSKDPRVALALGEAREESDRTVARAASIALFELYCPPGELETITLASLWVRTGDWWKANEADLRRRAKELPH
jgi:hypothetical protein